MSVARIHLHAIDHGEKILPAQLISQHGLVQSAGNELARTPGIKCFDLVAPGRSRQA